MMHHSFDINKNINYVILNTLKNLNFWEFFCFNFVYLVGLKTCQTQYQLDIKTSFILITNYLNLNWGAYILLF